MRGEAWLQFNKHQGVVNTQKENVDKMIKTKTSRNESKKNSKKK